MRRCALLVFLIVLAGCGEDERAAAPPKPDRVRIQERVAAYATYLLAGDGERACAQLTPEYRRESDERAQVGGVVSCASATSLYGEAVAGVLPKGVAVTPARVVVTIRDGTADAALALGPRVTKTRLRAVGSRWLIDELGVR